jgi:hypothetical protein
MINEQENNLILLKQSISLDKRIVPISMEFNVISYNSLFNRIMEESRFLEFVDKELDKSPNYIEFEGYTEEYKKKLKLESDTYKEVIKTSKPKITIKIELEKYE